MTKASRGAIAVAAVLLVSGCTAGSPPPASSPPPPPPAAPAPAFQLVAFDSCADVLASVKKAAKESVTPWGFPDGFGRAWASARAAGAAPESLNARDAVEKGDTGFSGTNTHEAGVDEPDLVKTDGRRIVTVSGQVLRVVDPASRRLTGTVDLGGDELPLIDPQLLLSGDRAMVLTAVPSRVEPGREAVRESLVPWAATTVRLITVDLVGLSVVGSYTLDGSLVDARQVGTTARIVVRSRPRITFPYREQGTDAQRLRDNRATIDRSTIDDWLPRWSSLNGGSRDGGRIDCGALRRPDVFSGTSLLTVLSFDIGGAYGTGDPTTILADGDLVYSNGPSLYVANDQRWRTFQTDLVRTSPGRPQDLSTVIYRFDVSAAGPPRYVAAGSIPGNVLNQYAMSEFDGHLRVATTLASNESSVYVLRVSDLARVGMVGGLGKGERIYSVRFAGVVGYVVTFRQTDPLYTVDLSNPMAPAVRGELKINGYSAYLHPAPNGRLIGVGQDADERGMTLGTQVSLFDVSNLSTPTRVAQHRIPGSYSEAEHDPHAFLYWERTGLLVVPVNTGGQQEMLALHLSGSKLTSLGTVRHAMGKLDYPPMIRRSLMVSGTLWTVSEAGMRATDPTSMRDQGWIAF
ncbi:beta-propeller domain-containing protein [Asanoa siamensis]|uniref:Beta propeller domain-containing protein n=1 Tax=Asanoa siamensis TaxID=926357 RepID=A0ABQ4CIG9_9ACTN|nr:beta-propeller domain-containing protein [Asanoa siamensis]GIF71102.1 hypothetical protein Asi02nite_06200 [Asanoa siamensis]